MTGLRDNGKPALSTPGSSLLRDDYFKGLWPKGAPIEAWAEVCIDPAVRLLAKYVLDLEARLDLDGRETNELMAVAYKQGKAEAVEITSDEARARFPGWGEDVA